MPYNIEQNGSCPDGKPFAVVGPSGKVMGCHATKPAARRQQAALYANEGKKKTAIKREAGMDFPPRDYAYVPDPLRPATWRLRLTEAPGQVSLEQVQRAAAAISPAGFRGNRLEIPPAAASSVKRRLLAEFRRLKVNEAQIPASVKEVDESSFMTWKDKKGNLRWFAVYSNNFLDDDNPPEILSEQSHKSYVALVDQGIVDYPDLQLWHVPGSEWGKADWVAYDNGFAMASGIVYPGFEHVADALSKRKDVRVSHGMPIPLIVYDPTDERSTIFHVTTEISPLPDWAAANSRTGFAILGKGDITMSLPKEKKQYLKEAGFADDVLARIEANLANAKQAAIDAGVESKEISDPEDDDEEEDVLEGDSDLLDALGDDEDEDEPEPEPVVAKSKKKATTAKAKPKTEEEDEAAAKPMRKAAKKEATPAVEYATREEIADAISAVFAPIMQQLKQLGGVVETMSKEINRLSASDEEKIAHTKEVTPSLSLTEMIMSRNPIGKEATKVKGSTTLGKDGPAETKAPVPQATMVPLINEFISGMYQSQAEDES